MIGDDALVEIMSSKSHKIRKEWLKDRKKRVRFLITIKVVRVLVKLREIQRENKNKGQILFDFN